MPARSFPALLAALTFMATALVAGTAPAQAHKCGTLFAIDNFQKHPKAPVSARTGKSIYCEAEAYYDSVYSEETEHFQIFYTLSGPHATIPAFIDSLKASLESAFEFEVNHLGMRRPQGRDSTHHYRKPVKDGLYPIEVVEIDFLRDPEEVLKAEACNGCFGVTHPDYEKDLRKSQIFIDNDFLYVPELNAGLDTIEVDGKACPYPVSTESMPNIAYDYYYKDEWAKAIRVTAFHEFYHAIQLQYMDLFKYKTVWTEASAVGIEEAGAPDIDDYFYHIADFMNATGTAINRMSNQYGVSLLFIDLYNHVDKNFDKSVWEQYAKSPSSSLENIFKTVLAQKGLDIGDVFHDFATRLSFSGKRATAIDSSEWISPDQPRWYRPLIRKRETFEPDTINFAYSFFGNGSPDITNYKGKISAALFRSGKADLRKIHTTATLDTVISDAFAADSITWIFSRIDTAQYIPILVRDSTLRAYPMPWRGKGSLCFTPLPENKKFIEIRNSRGDLVLREPYERTTHCIDGDYVKSKMKPGVYRFRAGSSGKAQKFLVVY